jgi:hypothetical protein
MKNMEKTLQFQAVFLSFEAEATTSTSDVKRHGLEVISNSCHIS